jgi:hypothetical protein
MPSGRTDYAGEYGKSWSKVHGQLRGQPRDRTLGVLANLRGVARFVFCDLEEQETVNGCKCVIVRAGNDDTSAAGGFLEHVANFILEFFHFRHSGRNRVVNEHGNIKIAALKRLRDVLHVRERNLSGLWQS